MLNQLVKDCFRWSYWGRKERTEHEIPHEKRRAGPEKEERARLVKGRPYIVLIVCNKSRP